MAIDQAIQSAPVPGGQPTSAAAPLSATLPSAAVSIPAGLVAVLAFLLASIPVRNSDFWMHLAAGRDLVHTGATSLSYVLDASWVNHTWLYDFLIYGGFTLLGGSAAVMVKAVLSAVLGLLLLAAGTGGAGKGSIWAAAAATMLSLIAMAPWLALRPIFVSFLCFAILLWLLGRFERGAVRASLVGTAVLFAFWVNLDMWFILGLLLVGCLGAGQMLSRYARSGSGTGAMDTAPRPAPFGLLALVSVAACLLNPSHVLVFLPAGEWVFSGIGRALDADPLLRHELLAPWREVYFSQRFVLSGPGLAFWLLTALSLASFGLGGERWADRGGRAITWAVFFVLSVFQSHVIAFFAMTTGVTLALHVGAWLVARPRLSVRSAGWARAGLVMTGLGLTAAAWIGVFQSSFLEPRGWYVDADPGIERLAMQLRQLREQGRLHGHALHLAPEVANQLAWWNPEEKSFLNSQLRVSPSHAAEYVRVRSGLLGKSSADGDWRSRLRAHDVGYVVVYSNDFGEVQQSTIHLLTMPREWSLLYLGGGAAIFGWRDPQQARPDATAFNTESAQLLAQLAYEPATARPAPESGPERGPEPFHWWQAFWKRRPFRLPDLRESELAVAAFDALEPAQKARLMSLWNGSLTASVLGHVAGPGLPGLALSGGLGRNLFFSSKDEGPAAALHIAVRAGRRAIDRRPSQAQAYLALGEAFYRLHSATRERGWSAAIEPLGRLRTVQMVNAYQNALRLDPDLTTAHDRLAHLFISMGYKDLALAHLREFLRCARRKGPLPGEDLRGMEGRLAKLEGIEKKLAKNIELLTLTFDINAANLKVYDRANLAGRLGLTGKSLEILLDSDVSAFGVEGMDLELKLLLVTGRTEDVRHWMTEEHERILDAYRWNKVQMHASRGDVALADAELASWQRFRALGREFSFHEAGALMLSNGVLAPTWGGPFSKLPLSVFAATGALPITTYRLLPDQAEIRYGLQEIVGGLHQQAKLTAVRGLLALESGYIEQAEQHFRKALAIFDSLRGVSRNAESTRAQDIARHGLDAIRRAR